MKRMWYEIPLAMRMRITSDEGVNTMFRSASIKRSPIHLLVEGEVDSEWEGEYDDEMRKMLREQRRTKTDVCSDEDGAKGGASCPNEDSNSASVGGESETHGSSSVDDFELERRNAECFEATTSIAEKNLDTVKSQVELHEESRDEKTITSKGCGEEIFLNTLKKGKRQRDDDHASHTNTTTKKSTCGQQSGNPQQVTRGTTRQVAKKQPPVKATSLPVEAEGPSRKKKKNDSKQVNPIRRSARLMRGPTGGTSDIMHLD
ncbi:hypothetical protein EUGRSUZ_C03241 [Eucalyptus grandis]|uniref:Uncharacterized protein n=2 Tax=Eucalyptus grandis TaxID=71139 RepID=A0ACC3LID3_EUCGR|nr:hypothetical protein EUGRSUZ_C03241 [Eucalyptus grandis]